MFTGSKAQRGISWKVGQSWIHKYTKQHMQFDSSSVIMDGTIIIFSISLTLSVYVTTTCPVHLSPLLLLYPSVLRLTFSSIRPSRPPVGIGKRCSGPFSMRPRPPNHSSRPHPYMHAHYIHSHLPCSLTSMSHPSWCHGHRTTSSCQRAPDHHRHRCSSMQPDAG